MKHQLFLSHLQQCANRKYKNTKLILPQGNSKASSVDLCINMVTTVCIHCTARILYIYYYKTKRQVTSSKAWKGQEVLRHHHCRHGNHHLGTGAAPPHLHDKDNVIVNLSPRPPSFSTLYERGVREGLVSKNYVRKVNH